MLFRFEAKDDLKFNIKYGVFAGNKVHAPFGVQYILDSVVSELLKNKNRRYVSLSASVVDRFNQERSWVRIKGSSSSQSQTVLKMDVRYNAFSKGDHGDTTYVPKLTLLKRIHLENTEQIT